MQHKKSTTITRLLTIFTLFTLLFTANAAYAGEAEGKALFQANCQKCHLVDRKMTGPALQNVRTRWADSTNLYKWIKNPAGFLATGDKYSNALAKEYGQVMQSFPSLTDANITDILTYIDAEALRKATAPPPGTPGNVEVKKDNSTLYWILIIALLFIAVILGRSVKYLDGLVRQKFDDPAPDTTPFWKKRKYRPLVGILALLFLCFLSVAMWDSATALGRQQDYAPEQPIAFSHKVHAGINKIDCKYCHVGAERGKSAVIPSLSVCMNCHYNIQGVNGLDPNYPKAVYDKEIAKIYSYIGFNKETSKYESEPKPVEWVKIHNLPDHVYFNHSQHVKVAGLECQTCHGQIQEMDVVQQMENLSMGWCVNCHRNTNVNFTTNEFYKPYEVLHEKIKNGEMTDVKASDIGATECQKCHY
ncbi:MAG: c-type cytochrome [Bacteroidetes bacterium]|nr:c-type cytochrome [Bacteroidota bacterium]